ncbi:hypothetical protein M427DRAFT_305861 [Gonapodya prolifera JEL478]|uniref:Uncharacterized protein n=1 Tax=Gonapodya prolifera (strain JEL478) TaxID=1344416 RepID=A0A139AGX1_GONPJ|nr:hypothetical protein M427DRAFT_305861 [Gonapodya prolifera JEL478]|eukprot:KXS15939.1 hypothetical protein M427DRAFT_305861 [Gonapodya prolifera JEL478]
MISTSLGLTNPMVPTSGGGPHARHDSAGTGSSSMTGQSAGSESAFVRSSGSSASDVLPAMHNLDLVRHTVGSIGLSSQQEVAIPTKSKPEAPSMKIVLTADAVFERAPDDSAEGIRQPSRGDADARGVEADVEDGALESDSSARSSAVPGVGIVSRGGVVPGSQKDDGTLAKGGQRAPPPVPKRPLTGGLSLETSKASRGAQGLTKPMSGTRTPVGPIPTAGTPVVPHSGGPLTSAVQTSPGHDRGPVPPPAVPPVPVLTSVPARLSSENVRDQRPPVRRTPSATAGPQVRQRTTSLTAAVPTASSPLAGNPPLMSVPLPPTRTIAPSSPAALPPSSPIPPPQFVPPPGLGIQQPYSSAPLPQPQFVAPPIPVFVPPPFQQPSSPSATSASSQRPRPTPPVDDVPPAVKDAVPSDRKEGSTVLFIQMQLCSSTNLHKWLQARNAQRPRVVVEKRRNERIFRQIVQGVS